MTLTLTYNPDLSRVQVAATDMTGDTVTVERSRNGGLYWETVRGATALPVTAGAANVDDFEFAADAENTYRLLDDAGTPIESAAVTPVLDTVWLKNLRYPFLNRAVEVVNFSDVERPGRTGLFPVQGRSTPVAVTDLHASPQFELETLTTTMAAARDLDLSVASGDVFLVHIPAGCPVPGGYVAIGDTAIGRRSNRTERRRHVLPCTVVTPPAADIVGTTLTWGTVFRLYGSWTALLAANPTWIDLLETVGSPDDLVVI